MLPVDDSYGTEATAGGALRFEQLVDLYYAPLYRFALNLSHTEVDASDLVQETFLTWASKGSQLQDPSKVKAWLFTTLHRHFLAGRRQAVRFPQIELSEAEAELPQIEPDWMDQFDGHALVKLLAQVDPVFQAPVALYYLEDYSYAEIAAILDAPMGTVKSRVARGLIQLRALLRHAALGGALKEPS